MTWWGKSPRMFLATLVAVGLLFGEAGPAVAHAILIESSPAVNGSVAGPTVQLSFRYNSRIDKGRSRLTLTYPDRSQKVLPIAAEGEDDILTSNADLPSGHYSLRWQVLAIDGHITRGDVPFDVTR